MKEGWTPLPPTDTSDTQGNDSTMPCRSRTTDAASEHIKRYHNGNLSDSQAPQPIPRQTQSTAMNHNHRTKTDDVTTSTTSSETHNRSPDPDPTSLIVKHLRRVKIVQIQTPRRPEPQHRKMHKRENQNQMRQIPRSQEDRQQGIRLISKHLQDLQRTTITKQAAGLRSTLQLAVLLLLLDVAARAALFLALRKCSFTLKGTRRPPQ